MKIGVFLLVLALFWVLPGEAQTVPQSVRTTQAPAPIGPYSQAVWAGTTLYVSGQIGLDPGTGQLASADLKTETTRVMENLRAVLNAAGLDFRHVVKVTIYLRDLTDFAAVNEQYGTYFREPFPARETVQVARLPRDARLEISCVAIK
jgi:2-iminobutanoate/2-iminopropanoate deaminase